MLQYCEQHVAVCTHIIATNIKMMQLGVQGLHKQACPVFLQIVHN